MQESTATLDVLAKAVCGFPDGTAHRLYVTGLSLGGAAILALQPPPIGEVIEITLYGVRLGPLPPIRARVTRVQNDVASVERNGFEVSFLDLDDGLLDRLTCTLIALDAAHVALPHLAESRSAFRVVCQLEARIETPGKACPGVIMDLSVSGALVRVAADALEAPPVRGGELGLIVVEPEHHETLTIGACVAWTAIGPRQRLIGVQFDRREGEPLTKIRDLILDVLALSAMEGGRNGR